MSSCFLCDCSYKFKNDEFDRYTIVTEAGSVKKYMKQLPIMIGSSGIVVDFDQQHNNNDNQNYVSYRVKKLEFWCSYSGESSEFLKNPPDYVLIFKVPFRYPVFDYRFGVMQKFMLYSEPESVLDYKVLQPREYAGGIHSEGANRYPRRFNITINKPFIVGPNDYVGVFYMFTPTNYTNTWVDASARVWFDVV